MPNPPDTNRPEPARKVTSDLAARIASAKKDHQVEAKEAAARASWLTPVPGGVGPLTIALLLRNCLQAAERS